VLLDNEISLNEARIEAREQGIQEVKHQISEVMEMFKDLAVMVDHQGTIGKSLKRKKQQSRPRIKKTVKT